MQTYLLSVAGLTGEMFSYRFYISALRGFLLKKQKGAGATFTTRAHGGIASGARDSLLDSQSSPSKTTPCLDHSRKDHTWT